MERRDFARTIVAGGLAGAALGFGRPVLGNVGSDREREFAVFGRIALRMAAGQIMINWLLISSAGRFLGLDLRQEMPQYRESGGARDIPLLGGLLRQPLSERFTKAELVARVVLLHNMLILLPIAGALQRVNRVAIAHRDLAWEPAGRPREVSMKSLPAPPELSALPVVGRAFLNRGGKRDLLVVIQPSVVTEPESES